MRRREGGGERFASTSGERGEEKERVEGKFFFLKGSLHRMTS